MPKHNFRRERERVVFADCFSFIRDKSQAVDIGIHSKTNFCA